MLACGVGSYWHLQRAALAIFITNNSLRFKSFHAALKPRWSNQAHLVIPVPAVTAGTREHASHLQRSNAAPSLEVLAVHSVFRGRRINLKLVRESTILLEHLLDRDKARKLAETMIQTSSPHKAQQVLDVAHKLGCHLKQNAYECAVFRLAERGHWLRIPVIVSLGMRHTGRTTTRLLNWRTRALIESNHFAHLEGLLTEFQRWNVKPNRITFHLLASGHIRNHNLVGARESLRIMEQRGFPVDSSTHTLIISAYRSLGPDAQVEAHAVKAMQDASPTAATTILNGLMKLRIEAGDVPGFLHVISLFDRMSHIVAIISSHHEEFFIPDGDSKSHRSAIIRRRSQPEQLPHCNVPFDAATFTILIDYLVAAKDYSRALTVYRNMLAMGVSPDVGIVAVLVRLCFGTGHEGTAIHAIARLCGFSQQLYQHLGPLLSESSNNPDFPIPTTAGLPLSTDILNALLKCLLDVHGTRAAYPLLRMMHAIDIKPNAKTIELLLAHLHDRDRAHPVLLLRTLASLLSDQVLPTLRHLHIVLRSILQRQKRVRYGFGWDVAAANFVTKHHNKFQQIPSSTITESLNPIAGIDLPDGIPYDQLLTPIVKSLAARHVKSDKAMLALRIRQDAVNKSDPDMAIYTFQTLLTRGMHPNAYHYSALMEGYVLQGNFRAAEAVLQVATCAGIQPNVVMYTILIAGHARRGDPEHATQVFRHMVTAGIRPDVPAIDALSSAYFVVGAHAKAKQVLCDLWPFIEPFAKRSRSAPLKTLIRKFRTLHKGNQGDQLTISPRSQFILRRWLDHLIKTWHGASGKGTKITVAPRVHHVYRMQPTLRAIGPS